MIKTIGSICSGIEAASVAWKDFSFDFKWLSEIAPFPSDFLKIKYPDLLNVGDMNAIPKKILKHEIDAPDLICGGTPCQAFSLAGFQNGLNDERGNLTLKFCEIINANDEIRKRQGKEETIVFWENVEGVLKDKTNAFGCFLSLLAGCKKELKMNKFPNAGLLRGPKRNIAWRILDAKYFGIPQQRRRLYVVAGGKGFNPENVLFEKHEKEFSEFKKYPLRFEKDGHRFEVFREYTDCLYSAYGTKWNGNAAAYNGSLFVVQDDRLRRFTPLECERLMGFPDNYTLVDSVRPTNRYQGVGNSWAVPVVKWIGSRIKNYPVEQFLISKDDFGLWAKTASLGDSAFLLDLGKEPVTLQDGVVLNGTEIPENIKPSNIAEIVEVNAAENLFISPVGCAGILRRKNERNLCINARLEKVLSSISSEWSEEKIQRISLVQPRGAYSKCVI